MATVRRDFDELLLPCGTSHQRDLDAVMAARTPLDQVGFGLTRPSTCPPDMLLLTHLLPPVSLTSAS